MKLNLYLGVSFLLMGCIGIYISIIQFSLEAIVITILEFSLGFTNLEVYGLKKSIKQGKDEVKQ